MCNFAKTTDVKQNDMFYLMALCFVQSQFAKYLKKCEFAKIYDKIVYVLPKFYPSLIALTFRNSDVTIM